MINKPLFPLMIDLNDKSIVIIGAGKVADRKAKLFLDYAQVTMINEDFSDELLKLAQSENAAQLTLINTNPSALSDDEIIHIITNAFLVISATADKSLNQHINNIAKSCHILTNAVDGIGEVIIPSVINQGDLTIGISTNGTSPAFSKYTRKKIEQTITPEYAQMAILQNEMREYYKLHVEDQEERKQLLWKILESETIWNALVDDYDKAVLLAKKLKGVGVKK